MYWRYVLNASFDIHKSSTQPHIKIKIIISGGSEFSSKESPPKQRRKMTKNKMKKRESKKAKIGQKTKHFFQVNKA